MTRAKVVGADEVGSTAEMDEARKGCQAHGCMMQSIARMLQTQFYTGYKRGPCWQMSAGQSGNNRPKNILKIVPAPQPNSSWTNVGHIVKHESSQNDLNMSKNYARLGHNLTRLRNSSLKFFMKRSSCHTSNAGYGRKTAVMLCVQP